MHRERPHGDEEPPEADTEGDEGESAEPHEVALAREEINMLLAEQRKTAVLKVGATRQTPVEGNLSYDKMPCHLLVPDPL